MTKATLSSIVNLTPTLFLLTLKPEAPIGFKAGQFVIIPLPPDPQAAPGSKPPKGFYSIASPEQEHGALQLLVEHREGYVSGWVCSRKPGEVLDLDGPLGKFGLHDLSTRTQIFLGSKAGIAPLRSMILTLASAAGQPAQHLHLFLGAVGSEGLIFDSQWRALEKSQPKFHYHPVVSPSPSNPFVGKNEDPADALIKAMVHRQGHDIYLAGFNAEVDPMLAKLQAAGFDKDFIRAEKFG